MLASLLGFAIAEVWLAVVAAVGGPRMSKAIEEFPFLTERATLFGPLPGKLPQAASTSLPPSSEKRLQVFCLGPLSLLRDGEAIPAKAFKRKKARELLAILLASPDSYFHREELAGWLWPEADQKASLRDFWVARHALSDTLEPERAKNTTAFCIGKVGEVSSRFSPRRWSRLRSSEFSYKCVYIYLSHTSVPPVNPAHNLAGDLLSTFNARRCPGRDSSAWDPA